MQSPLPTGHDRRPSVLVDFCTCAAQVNHESASHQSSQGPCAGKYGLRRTAVASHHQNSMKLAGCANQARPLPASAARAGPRRCVVARAQELPGLQTLQDGVSNHKALQAREKEVMSTLRKHNKRVKSLAKEMKKAATSRKPELLLAMQAAIAETEVSRVSWSMLVEEMIAAGLEGHDGSSSDEDCGPMKSQSVAVRSEADIAACLQTLETGTVTVCTGKACANKGGSAELQASLSQHFDSFPAIKVEESGCMGYCKKCANVLVRSLVLVCKCQTKHSHQGDVLSGMTVLTIVHAVEMYVRCELVAV